MPFLERLASSVTLSLAYFAKGPERFDVEKRGLGNLPLQRPAQQLGRAVGSPQKGEKGGVVNKQGSEREKCLL